MKRIAAFLLVFIFCFGIGVTASADLNVVKTVTLSEHDEVVTVEDVTVESYFGSWLVANVSATVFR